MIRPRPSLKRLKRSIGRRTSFIRAATGPRPPSCTNGLKNRPDYWSVIVKGGDDYRAALMFEKGGDLAGAMEAFTRFAQNGEEQAARLREEKDRELAKNHLLKAAVRSFALGDYRESADFFYGKKVYNLALPQYQALGDHEKAADCFYRLKDYYQAALEIEQSQLPDKWAKSATLLSYHLGEGRREARRELKLLQEGEQFLKEGDPDRALVRFKTVNAPDLVREAFHQTGRDQEALDYLSLGQLLGRGRPLRGKSRPARHQPDFYPDRPVQIF